ncbi:MAG: hypothetical protein ACFFD4_15105 [Candidatus Odinarchaeota archaeon]
MIKNKYAIWIKSCFEETDLAIPRRAKIDGTSEKCELILLKESNQKLKVVFVDMVDVRSKRKRTLENLPPYSTFSGYKFDSRITFREKQLFGWTTVVEKETGADKKIEICIHVINFNFLQEKGVFQRFYSRHGPDYDDDYSYLQGMNILAFEGFSRNQTRRSVERLINVFEKSSVLVDKPWIGLLVPSKTLKTSWTRQLRSNIKNFRVSSDIFDLLPDISAEVYVDFSLSHGYGYHLESYIELLKSILKNLY